MGNGNWTHYPSTEGCEFLDRVEQVTKNWEKIGTEEAGEMSSGVSF